MHRKLEIAMNVVALVLIAVTLGWWFIHKDDIHPIAGLQQQASPCPTAFVVVTTLGEPGYACRYDSWKEEPQP